MAERLRNLIEYVSPYVKEAVFGVKSSVRTLVEALRNLFPPLVEAANWRAHLNEAYINKARIFQPPLFTRFLALGYT